MGSSPLGVWAIVLLLLRQRGWNGGRLTFHRREVDGRHFTPFFHPTIESKIGPFSPGQFAAVSSRFS
jgi:hypothetical protein